MNPVAFNKWFLKCTMLEKGPQQLFCVIYCISVKQQCSLSGISFDKQDLHQKLIFTTLQ